MEKRKNTMMRAAGCMLMLGLLSTCAISGTFAKYTDTTTGTGSARVAKWNITAAGTTITDTFEFDLYETLIDTKNGATEGNVVSANSDKVIAPGTQGEFTLSFKNESEVTAEYTVDYTVTKNGIPVQFSIDDGATWTDDLADVTTAVEVAIGATAEINVQWKWAFDGNDTTDTGLGEAGTAKLEVKAAVTFTQVD